MPRNHREAQRRRARWYRRAVDQRLFQLGEERYRILVDTLIQLRHPQLTKTPDETRLSSALTAALPPVAAEMIDTIAEAMILHFVGPFAGPA